jgi:peptidoglycan LD-endopeptidase LytH
VPPVRRTEPMRLPAPTTRRIALAAAVLLVVSLAPPAGADTRAELEAAQAQVAELRSQAEQAAADYQAAFAALSETQDAIAGQEAQLVATEQHLVELQQRAAERAIEAYMGGAYEDPLGVDADTALDAGRREALLDNVAADDVDLVESLETAREDAERLRSQLEDLRAQQDGLAAQMDAASDAALARLDEAQQLEAQLQARYAAELEEQRRREAEERARREAEERARQEAERAAAAAARTTTTQGSSSGGGGGGGGTTQTTSGSSSGSGSSGSGSSGGGGGGGGGSIPSGYACPVPGSSFVDSWGASRSGGRAHQGVDMMAGFGTPNYAVTSGTVRSSSSSLGGISLYLYGDDGNTYYSAHLQTITTTGAVSQGQQIGETGNTGNASGGSPHTHFEVHPGGGGAVNPTPYVRAWC